MHFIRIALIFSREKEIDELVSFHFHGHVRFLYVIMKNMLGPPQNNTIL